MIKDKIVDIDKNTFVGTAPKDKKHLAVYILIIFGFKIPAVSKCHNSQLDALWTVYASIEEFEIWYAMRGSGKTQLLSCLSVLESMFKNKCGIAILGGSLEQSKRCVEYLETFWNRPLMPKNMLICRQVMKTGYKLTNGSWIKALAASSKSVRGLHGQKLRIDEADEIKKEIYFAALGQPKSNFDLFDNVLVSSTLQYSFGLMSEIIDNKEDYGAVLFCWCYKDMIKPFGFWNKSEVENRKRQITKEMFEAEYELKRPMVDGNIFDYVNIINAYERGKNDRFNASNKYTFGGIDWGFNVTAITVIQEYKENFKIVDRQSFQALELSERCRLIGEIAEDYNINTLYCDSNPKDNNYTLRSFLRENFINTNVIPINFGIFKDVAINVIRYMLEKNILNINDNLLKNKMIKYHYKDVRTEKIAKVDDHEIDSLIAWSASHYKLIINEFERRKKLEMKLKILPRNLAN